MIAESVKNHPKLTQESISKVHHSISELHKHVPENFVISAPEAKLLHIKALSYADPLTFTQEFEEFIQESLATTQKNKILLFLSEKINDTAKPYEKNKAEEAAKFFVSKVLKKDDYIDYWNSGLNSQQFWTMQDKLLPAGAVYFKGLLTGVNDQLVYKLEKAYAQTWEAENLERLKNLKQKEEDTAPEQE
jgi:hypothetical protein